MHLFQKNVFQGLLLALFTGVWLQATAQAPVKKDSTLTALNQKLPTRNNDFCLEVKARLDKVGTPESELLSKRFITAWVDRRFAPADLDRMAAQANQMLESGYDMYPDVGRYLSAAAQVTSPYAMIRVPLKDFYAFVDSSYAKVGNKEMRQLLQRLERLILLGFYDRDELYRWRLQRLEGNLKYVRITDPYTGMQEEFPGLDVRKCIFSIRKEEKDSISIEDAAGRLDLLAGVFHGTKGRYSWQSVGLDPAQVYCNLSRFTADIKQNGFTSDSATFYYNKVLNKPLKGQLVDKLVRVAKYPDAQYPQFTSYDAGVVLTDVVRGADYEGGFTMRGPNRYGTSTESGPATLYIKSRKAKPKGSQRVLRLQGKEYSFRDSIIKAEANRVTVLLPDGDSMVHPRMRLVYDPFKPMVELVKDIKNPTYPQPMSSSYHKYNLYYEYLKWVPTSDTVTFANIIDQEDRLGALESKDYFLIDRFNQYRGILTFNPVALLYKYDLERKAARDRAKKKREEAAKGSENPDGSTSYGEFDIPAASGDTPPPATGAASEEDPFSDTEDSDVADAGSGEDVYFPTEGDSTATAPPPPKKTVKKPAEQAIEVDKFLKAYKLHRQKGAFINQLYKMEAVGYVRYEPATERIFVLPRLRTWSRAAWKLKDYDVIQIVSKTKDSKNFQLDITNQYLQANGVESFTLSDSQMVTVRPQDKFVLVSKNRDLKFGGLVYAGKLSLYGKGTDKFRFDYRNFNVKTAQLDSVKFAPRRDRSFDPNKNARLTRALEALKIEGVNGAVYINKPNNKSGIKRVKMYPTFDCYTNSFVFWNSSSIQKGQYKREKLNFALDPFLLDSLENFVIDNLEFLGEFSCNDIVPAFRDTLKPVADNTYGIREFFPNGVDLYKGKGRFTNELVMDGYGLHGKGDVAFLGSVATADTFTFHMDSVMATTKKFVGRDTTIAGTYYPAMSITKAKIKWYPQKDLLELETLKEPLVVHGGQGTFRGKVRITPKGAIGSGLIVLKLAQIESDSINLSDPKMVTQQSTFRIAFANDSTKYHVVVRNAEVTADLAAKTFVFTTAEPGVPLVAFPQQKYETSMARGSYRESDSTIVMEAKYPDKKYNTFKSIDPAQEGLSFAAAGGTYVMREQKMIVTGVDSILVADAVLYPDRDSAVIKKNGFLDAFKNARVVVDTTHRWHEITQADINVQSRKSYGGSGAYPYLTKGIPKQPLVFAKISTTTEGRTFARGIVKEEQNFFVTNRIYFRDTVELNGDNKFLTFKGFVKIQANSAYLAQAWFKFKDPAVNPDSVFVPIDKAPKNRSGKPLTVGVHFDGPRRQFYSYFFREKKTRTDRDVLLAQGFLTYDQSNREFIVGPLNKLSVKAYKGSLMRYDDDLNLLTSQGYFNVPCFFNDKNPVTLEMAGKWRHDNNNMSVLTDMVVRLDLPALPAGSQALGMLHRAFSLQSLSSSDVNFLDRLTQESFAELLDRDDTLSLEEANTKEFVRQANSGGIITSVKVAEQLPASFLFNSFKLNYSDEVKGFWSFFPVGLVGIGGKTLNKMVDTKFEYRLGRRLPSGQALTDTLRMYLQVDENTWVFYEVRNDEVRTVGSEAGYNAAIDKESEGIDKKNEKNKDDYPKLVKITEAEKQQFIRRFSKYLLMKTN